MKILVIATGGTIGSDFDGSSIDVIRGGGCPVAERYAAERSEVRFDIINPLNILSERLSADDLTILAEVLLTTDYSRFDGVIITAGSDNLAYLSAFIGLLCADIGVPVCIVATNMILTDPRSNGEANFACAVELIRQGIAGVYVPYRNSDGVMYIHEATDIRQADMSDDFYGFHGAYAVYDGSFRTVREPILQKLPAVFDRESLPLIRDNVLLIHPYPLQDYSRFSIDGVKAVLHTLYHSATLDSSAAERFIGSLGETPLFLASLRSDRKIYATTAEALAMGAIPLYDLSPECAYMKLLLGCAQSKITIRKFMEVKE